MVENYHTYNGIFNDEVFIQKLLKSDRKIEFSVTGNPHHNGATEREIKIVVNMERATMLHTDRRCP